MPTPGPRLSRPQVKIGAAFLSAQKLILYHFVAGFFDFFKKSQKIEKKLLPGSAKNGRDA